MISEANGRAAVDAAIGYIERRLPITICDRNRGEGNSRGKIPLGAGWQNERWTAEEVEDIARGREINVGLRLGPEAGLVDFEADSDEEEADFAALFEGAEIPITPTFKSRRGKHRFFKWHPRLEEIGQATVKFRRLCCRIGADGKGAHSCVPPSVNTDGTVRKWLIPPDEVEPAELPAIVVQRLIDAAKGKSEKASATNGESHTSQSTNGAAPEWVAEAIAAMRRVPIADKGDGSTRLLLYSRCAVEFGLSDAQAVRAVQLVAVDKPFPQQWSDADIIRRVRDAETKTERGCRAGTATAIEYQRLTSSELDSGDFALEYLADGVLVRGQPDILGGSKKTLKTSIGVDLGVSLATAGHFLGYFPVQNAVRVAFMSGESGLATLQDTARRVCAAARFSLADVGNLIWSPDLPRLGDPSHMKALGQFLKDDEIEVLFVDPAYLTMPGADAGNLLIQGELLRNITETCRDVGATLVLLHHTKRGRITEQFTPFDLDDLAWAGFAEFARQWILLSRRSLYVPGTGHHELWLSIGGSAGHGGLWGLDIDEGRFEGFGSRRWEVRVLKADEIEEREQQHKDAARDAKAQRQVERDAAHILRTVVCMDGQQGTANEIRDRAKRGGQAVNSALAYLVDQGQIEEVDITKGKRSYPGFRVVAGGGE